jgi:hypothetical protein
MVGGKGRHLGKSDVKKRLIIYIQAGIRGADKRSGALRDSIIGGFDIIVIVREITPRTHTRESECCLLSKEQTSFQNNFPPRTAVSLKTLSLPLTLII